MQASTIVDTANSHKNRAVQEYAEKRSAERSVWCQVQVEKDGCSTQDRTIDGDKWSVVCVPLGATSQHKSSKFSQAMIFRRVVYKTQTRAGL